MADDSGQNQGTQDAGSAAGGGTPAAGGSAGSRVLNFMQSNKIEAGLWLTRLFTIFSSIFFLLPIFGGNMQSLYQRALIANAATSALRLHQRLPNFQLSQEFSAKLKVWQSLIANAATSALRLHQRLPNFQLSREFLGLVMLEDSAHYLFYSLIFIMGHPISMSLVPVFLFAVLHSASYTIKVLDQIGPQSVTTLRNLIGKLTANQRSVLRFIACNEIFMMPAIVFMIFTGYASLLLPFIYYRFVTLRYTSRRNPYCRQLFYELRITTEHLCSQPNCPQFIRNMCFKSISFISRLAPPVQAQ